MVRLGSLWQNWSGHPRGLACTSEGAGTAGASAACHESAMPKSPMKAPELETLTDDSRRGIVQLMRRLAALEQRVWLRWSWNGVSSWVSA